MGCNIQYPLILQMKLHKNSIGQINWIVLIILCQKTLTLIQAFTRSEISKIPNYGSVTKCDSQFGTFWHSVPLWSSSNVLQSTFTLFPALLPEPAPVPHPICNNLSNWCTWHSCSRGFILIPHTRTNLPFRTLIKSSSISPLKSSQLSGVHSLPLKSCKWNGRRSATVQNMHCMEMPLMMVSQKLGSIIHG